jgi:hypothetical protein
MSCKYNNIFGKVNTGVHSVRIWNLAIVDIAVVFVIASIIKSYFPHYNYTNILVILFVAGIVMHRLFCVRTTVDKLLFPNELSEESDELC